MTHVPVGDRVALDTGQRAGVTAFGRRQNRAHNRRVSWDCPCMGPGDMLA